MSDLAKMEKQIEKSIGVDDLIIELKELNEERKIGLNEFANILNIKLIKGTKNSIFYMVEYINNGENLKTY